MRTIWLAVLAACSDGSQTRDLIVTSTFTLSAVSGDQPSPLDPYVGQAMSFALTFTNADDDNDSSVACERHLTFGEGLGEVATGATADIVTSYILDRMPGWEARLELCDPASMSSASIFADNELGLGISIGCLELPASAIVRDGDGHPAWTTFEPSRCDGTIYDESNGRIFGTSGLVMTFGFSP